MTLAIVYIVFQARFFLPFRISRVDISIDDAC